MLLPRPSVDTAGSVDTTELELNKTALLITNALAQVTLDLSTQVYQNVMSKSVKAMNLFVLRFYDPVNSMASCRVRSVRG